MADIYTIHINKPPVIVYLFYRSKSMLSYVIMSTKIFFSPHVHHWTYDKHHERFIIKANMCFDFIDIGYPKWQINCVNRVSYELIPCQALVQQ
jgi:hypothetical protein